MKALLFFIGIILITSNSVLGQLIDEPFTDGSLPAGWSQNSVTFTTSAGGYANFTSNSATLTSPAFNAGTACSLRVEFDVAKFGTGGDGPVTIQYSLNGGSTWVTLGNSTTPTSATYQSNTMTIPAVSNNMMIRITRTGSASQKRFRNLVVTALGNCGSSNTITTGTVSGGPFTVTCTTTDAGTVAFTSAGTFTAGNTYTAQLSDAAGSFSSPTTIGTLVSTGNSGSITITIPSAVPSGTGYRIRIVSSNPAATGSTSAAFSITLSGGPCTLQEPHITSVIYNGCNGGSCQEGQSEVVFANTGGYSIAINNANNIDLNYTAGTSYDMLLYFVNGSTVTNELNTAAGCPGLFVNGIATTIPPNSSMMFVSEAFCPENYNGWDDFCGEGPIYVIYGRDGTSTTSDGWVSGGNFGNSGTDRTFNLQVTATNGTTYTTNYTYDGSGSDGRYAIYGSSYPTGTNPRTPVSNGTLTSCSFTPIVLASDLIAYEGTYENHQSVLTWKTASERNNSHFSVFRSTDGINWNEIGTVTGSGNSNQPRTYELIDNIPENGTNYYRLQSHDFDGKIFQQGIVSIDVNELTIYYNQATASIELSENSTIEIYATDGRRITQSTNSKHIPFHHSGVFLVHDTDTGKTVRILIK